MSRLSDLIKAKRKSSNISLRDFSEKCQLSHTYIKNLEDSTSDSSREIVPTIDSLARIAHALEMPLEELLKETGYIKDKNRRFEPSNLKLIRGKMSYAEVAEDIRQKTGQDFDAFMYEDIEKGEQNNLSPFIINLLSEYAGANYSFFFWKNSIDDLQKLQLQNECKKTQSSQNKQLPYYSKDAELAKFIENPSNKEYLRLAKELSEKKIKVKLVRNLLFEE